MGWCEQFQRDLAAQEKCLSKIHKRNIKERTQTRSKQQQAVIFENRI